MGKNGDRQIMLPPSRFTSRQTTIITLLVLAAAALLAVEFVVLLLKGLAQGGGCVFEAIDQGVVLFATAFLGAQADAERFFE